MHNIRETLAQQVRELDYPAKFVKVGYEDRVDEWRNGRDAAASLIASSPELAELMAENERLERVASWASVAREYIEWAAKERPDEINGAGLLLSLCPFDKEGNLIVKEQNRGT